MRALLVGFFLAVWMGPGTAQQYPDYQEVYVNDYADLMSDAEEQVVREKLQEIRAEAGIEFTVLTISQMSDYGHSGAIEPFATGLFNSWGIGDASRNDGILMLVSQFDRTMRIEVGSGYGDSKNDAMAAIIDEYMIPHFRDQDYARGIDRGVDAVIREITGSWPGEFDANFFQKIWNRISGLVSSIGDWIAVFYAAVAGALYRLYRKYKRDKPRKCVRDGSKMRRLNEALDDAHLTDGERMEEKLKSVDYDVWVCDQCDRVTIESYKSWFSNLGACRSCNYRTLRGTTTIINAATTSSTGLRRIDFHCENCDDRYSTHEVIPKKTKSSSSSSSGGFGGGSSSGGGASGSW